MAAQRAHPAQQLPALLLVDQRNQLEADLERQVFQAQQRRQIRALRLLGLLLLAGVPTRPEGRGAAAATRAPPRKARGHGQKSQLGQSRNQAHGAPRPGWPDRAWPAWPASCWRISPPSMPAELARVSVMPPATETSSEGIIVTSPSPTVSTV
jgi:hypothetical protein